MFSLIGDTFGRIWFLSLAWHIDVWWILSLETVHWWYRIHPFVVYQISTLGHISHFLWGSYCCWTVWLFLFMVLEMFDGSWQILYCTSDTHTVAYSLSVEIYRSSWSCMFIPTYKIHVKTMIYLLSYYDLLGESLLSHSVRPILFRRLDVIMLLILGDTFLICWPDSAADMDD